ncbi:putative Two-component system sensor kinase [Streptomyces viridochromogenes Tue57]|uniref:histidine kinase n=1 Tax=Streptomyces viridochromogenes Tue57 TaxID=1160705 RepID=L8P638_STRVR|nr:putative Two-component system sensor kinase [Streptomyces viridochromogenes Tue57]
MWLTLPTRTVHERVHHVWLLLGLGGLAVLTAVAVVGFAIACWTGRPIRELELAGSVGPVPTVPGGVEQIVDNLLSDALRAPPRGSTVTMELRLHAPARRALRDARPAWVDLRITDEGPGMTPDQRARAFDRFWRAPGAPKGGTGLVLSLVQRLAHASGGEASLHAAAAGGLDAVIRLPSAEAPREGHGPGPDRPGQRKRVVPALRG